MKYWLLKHSFKIFVFHHIYRSHWFKSNIYVYSSMWPSILNSVYHHLLHQISGWTCRCRIGHQYINNIIFFIWCDLIDQSHRPYINKRKFWVIYRLYLFFDLLNKTDRFIWHSSFFLSKFINVAYVLSTMICFCWLRKEKDVENKESDDKDRSQ